MRVLVTGGAGYVGSVTCEVLLEQGHSIGVVDNLMRGHREAIPSDAGWWNVDLRDCKALEQCFGEFRPDAVVHFAAFCLVGESMENPGSYFENNVGGSLSLLQTMVSQKVAHIVFSSSAAVFSVNSSTARCKLTFLENSCSSSLSF